MRIINKLKTNSRSFFLLNDGHINKSRTREIGDGSVMEVTWDYIPDMFIFRYVGSFMLEFIKIYKICGCGFLKNRATNKNLGSSALLW